MKYLVGFACAILALLIIKSVDYFTIIEIPKFFIGWFSCMGWYIGIEAHKNFN